ncbi:MAG: SPFH domain-containing protein [Lachnospiraceae bacterium]|nr:SPFH domain-containing protein [Lachnospiraceae bacterium]
MGFKDFIKSEAKEIISVIKFEGDGQALVWKHPKEDFNINSQVVVNESQEAIFFNGGEALDLLGPGTHTLKTANLPLVGELIKKVTDGVSPFHCQIYFINKAEAMAIKWGTPDPVLIEEDGIGFKLGAGGDMSIRVSDSRKLLVKLVGTNALLERSQFMTLFRGLISSHVGDLIINTKREKGYSFFEMDGKKREFSDSIKEKLRSEFGEYGIEIEQFNLTRFVFPEDDEQYKRMMKLKADKTLAVGEKELEMQLRAREVEMKRYEMEQEAYAMAGKRSIEGYSYQQERGFDVAERFAEKQGGNDMVNLGIGLGMMNSVGKSVSDNLGTTVNAAMTAAVVAPHVAAQTAPQMQPASSVSGSIKCAKCGNELPENAKFCLNCGEKVEQVKNDTVICPACGKPTPKGKFCMECGTPMASVCPNCGREVPAGGKFCLECGTKI